MKPRQRLCKSLSTELRCWMVSIERAGGAVSVIRHNFANGNNQLHISALWAVIKTLHSKCKTTEYLVVLHNSITHIRITFKLTWNVFTMAMPVDDVCSSTVPHSHICHVSHSSCSAKFIAHINFRQTEDTHKHTRQPTQLRMRGKKNNDFPYWMWNGTQWRCFTSSITSNNRNINMEHKLDRRQSFIERIYDRGLIQSKF